MLRKGIADLLHARILLLLFVSSKCTARYNNSNEAATSASRGIAYHTVRLRKPLWAGS